MLRSHQRRACLASLAPLVLACAALIAACSGGDREVLPEATATATPAATPTPEETATPAATPTPEAYTFPAGPAVRVAADYQPPEDGVASTGAHLPANGKPTLVFVDAIW